MAATKPSTIPEFQATALDEISAHYQTLRTTYRTNRTKDKQFRIKQIRKLYWAIVDNAALIEDALMQDLGKGKIEANLTEIDWCKSECMTLANNLEKWTKDEKIVGMPAQYSLMKPRMRTEPLGTILIIGAFNYPIQLNLVPVIGAIAAGNTVILKPSELSPRSAMVLSKIFAQALDPECYVCVNGALKESQHLLSLKVDKVVFTGGKKTGAIIATKAAESLTPVLLELGGQNPAFVTRNADIKLAAKRLMFQKLLNDGQVCLSHNYVLIDRQVVNQFISEINVQFRKMMPGGAKGCPDLCRIVNTGHFNRLKKMLDESRGKIVMGGSIDEKELFIEPTAVLVDDIEDSMMIDESFGPIWSIMPFDTLDEAIDIANKVDPTPLSLTTFGSDEENQKVLYNVTSGGATCNDSFFHCQVPASPIGGIGGSGTGSYHGYYSIKAFSHQRPIAQVPGWADKLLEVRYMPYDIKKLKQFQWLSQAKPNFDRNGDPAKGLKYWVGLVFGLGSKSASGSVLRWGLLLAITAIVGLKNGSIGRQ